MYVRTYLRVGIEIDPWGGYLIAALIIWALCFSYFTRKSDYRETNLGPRQILFVSRERERGNRIWILDELGFVFVQRKSRNGKFRVLFLLDWLMLIVMIAEIQMLRKIILRPQQCNLIL